MQLQSWFILGLMVMSESCALTHEVAGDATPDGDATPPSATMCGAMSSPSSFLTVRLGPEFGGRAYLAQPRYCANPVLLRGGRRVLQEAPPLTELLCEGTARIPRAFQEEVPPSGLDLLVPAVERTGLCVTETINCATLNPSWDFTDQRIRPALAPLPSGTYTIEVREPSGNQRGPFQQDNEEVDPCVGRVFARGTFEYEAGTSPVILLEPVP